MNRAMLRLRDLLGITLLWSLGQSSFAAPSASSSRACPQDFESLISQMLREIPAYANRVNIRANNRQNSVLVAGQANFEALPLQQSSFPETDEMDSEVRQVFFSTLLRRFSQQQTIHQQEYHWLLMAPSDRGWEFVQMYSILDSYPAQAPASTPRDSSNGAMATAIKDWLNVCYTAS